MSRNAATLPVAVQAAGVLALAGATVGALVVGLGHPAALVAGLAITFVGALGAARILAGGENRFRHPILRRLAHHTRHTWVNWGTGVYGLGALTYFIYLESRWLFALAELPRGIPDRSITDWSNWFIVEAMEALVHAIASVFWPIDLYGVLGFWVTVAVIASAWLAWKLVWLGVAPPPGDLDSL